MCQVLEYTISKTFSALRDSEETMGWGWGQYPQMVIIQRREGQEVAVQSAMAATGDKMPGRGQ